MSKYLWEYATTFNATGLVNATSFSVIITEVFPSYDPSSTGNSGYLSLGEILGIAIAGTFVAVSVFYFGLYKWQKRAPVEGEGSGSLERKGGRGRADTDTDFEVGALSDMTKSARGSSIATERASEAFDYPAVRGAPSSRRKSMLQSVKEMIPGMSPESESESNTGSNRNSRSIRNQENPIFIDSRTRRSSAGGGPNVSFPGGRDSSFSGNPNPTVFIRGARDEMMVDFPTPSKRDSERIGQSNPVAHGKGGGRDTMDVEFPGQRESITISDRDNPTFQRRSDAYIDHNTAREMRDSNLSASDNPQRRNTVGVVRGTPRTDAPRGSMASFDGDGDEEGDSGGEGGGGGGGRKKPDTMFKKMRRMSTAFFQAERTSDVSLPVSERVRRLESSEKRRTTTFASSTSRKEDL